MNKFKKIFEKPLLIASSIFIAVFIAAIVVMICIPHGNEYYFGYELEDTRHEYVIKIGEKYTEEHHMFLNGEEIPVEDMRTSEYEYEIYNGELYVLDGGATKQREKVGDINSREIVLTYSVLGEANHNTVLVCKTNRTLTNIFVMGLYISIFLLIISIMMIIIHKHHDKKSMEKAAASVDSTSTEDGFGNVE